MNWVQVYRDDVIASIFGTGFGRLPARNWSLTLSIASKFAGLDH